VSASTDGSPFSRPDDGNFCEEKLALSWQRADSTDIQGSMESTFIDCYSSMRTAMFRLTFNLGGYVINSTKVSDFEDSSTFFGHNQTQAFILEANKYIGDAMRPGNYDYGWHNDTFTRDWFNFLLKYYLNSTDLIDPAKEVPDATLIIPVTEDLYQRLFAILLGLNLSLFNSTAKQASVGAALTTVETRIFLDNGAFIVSMTILCLDILVLTTLYIKIRHIFLPRLPSSIASQIAYVAASRVVEEYDDERDASRAALPKSARTYTFGRFIGVDGRAHVGIDSDPYVVPLQASAPKEMRSAGFRKLFFWRKHRSADNNMF
jgi:hypothetical protein